MTSNRIPLIADDIPLDTPSARRFGANILGRALGHMTDLGDTIDADWWPANLAISLGFTAAEAWIATDAYLELLGA